MSSCEHRIFLVIDYLFSGSLTYTEFGRTICTSITCRIKLSDLLQSPSNFPHRMAFFTDLSKIDRFVKTLIHNEPRH